MIYNAMMSVVIDKTNEEGLKAFHIKMIFLLYIFLIKSSNSHFGLPKYLTIKKIPIYFEYPHGYTTK